MAKLNNTKLSEFRKELRILLSQEGYTKEQIKCLIFKPTQYVRFAYPRFAEFQFTVIDCNDKDRIDSNIDRDLLELESTASQRVFGFNVFSLTTLEYLTYEADYQHGFALEKAEDDRGYWEEQRTHLSDARSFLALKNRAIKNLEGKTVEHKEREGFRLHKNSNPLERPPYQIEVNGKKITNPDYFKCTCPYWVYTGANGVPMNDKAKCEFHGVEY